MKSTLLCLGSLLLLLGCQRDSESVQQQVRSGQLIEDQRITVLDDDREFHLFVPDAPVNAPIVLLLHGNGGSSDQILGITDGSAPYRTWIDIARRNNIILVVPNGAAGPNGNRGWNDCRSDASTNPETDDVRFLGDLIDLVKDRHASTASRVFAVGTSNGGVMAMRLAEETPERLDAVAFIVASKPVHSECSESRIPVPVLIMNGTDDPILPYDGGRIAGDRGEVYSTRDTIDYWVGRNGTNGVPIHSDLPDIDLADRSTIRRYSYTDPAGAIAVEHYEVVDGGHTEPSILERYGRLFRLVVGNQNGDIEMADEVWTFFNRWNGP